MDINDLRVIITVVSFAAFVGIVWWAWSGRSKAAFDQAAQLPFLEDDNDLNARNDTAAGDGKLKE
ncbi:MAG TPA: cbb3-type cytochrome c oxidase subunit 3 [Burkholderiales bacterium]|nr:cbb3-type cytochrome c oxidase subunit 3 [Burkholderiales bacterium]